MAAVEQVQRAVSGEHSAAEQADWTPWPATGRRQPPTTTTTTASTVTWRWRQTGTSQSAVKVADNTCIA